MHKQGQIHQWPSHCQPPNSKCWPMTVERAYLSAQPRVSPAGSSKYGASDLPASGPASHLAIWSMHHDASGCILLDMCVSYKAQFLCSLQCRALFTCCLNWR